MIVTPLCQTIIVRYARKPIWMPTARSKLFRIAAHNFYNEEEIKQIKILHQAYRHQERAIQELMRQEFYVPATQAGGLPVEFVEKEKELDKKSLEENQLENARIAKIREEYTAVAHENMKQKVLEAKFKKEEEFLVAATKAEQYIQEQKSDNDSFVTEKNIDAMIERALNNPINYEFCIDRQGRSYKGG